MGEITVRINPLDSQVTVEENDSGVISYKKISIDNLIDCIKDSVKTECISSGLLPQNCISLVVGTDGQRNVTILHSEKFADISYYKTKYEHFPLPQLLFKFKLSMGMRVQSCQLAVVKDEKLTEESVMYKYPFSNVNGYSLCVGRNTLPICERLSTLSSLPYYILSMENNDDYYMINNNKQKLEYRDLLEQLKNKDPSYYYESVLIPNGDTLKEFLEK